MSRLSPFRLCCAIATLAAPLMATAQSVSLGVPAITIGGGGKGEGAHTLSEWYQDGPDGYKGPQWALLIVTALAGVGRGVIP